jgi:hypothetical protein
VLREKKDLAHLKGWPLLMIIAGTAPPPHMRELHCTAREKEITLAAACFQITCHLEPVGTRARYIVCVSRFSSSQ